MAGILFCERYPDEPAVSTMPDPSPSAVVRSLFDALNAGEAARAAHHLAPNYRGFDATQSAVTMGRDEAHLEIQKGLDAFAPAFSVQQCLTDPPHVFVFWHMDAVHEGSFLQIPPTHQPVAISGTGVFNVRDGEITRGLHLWDLAGLLRAVNLLPDLPDNRPEQSSSLDAPILGMEPPPDHR